MVLSNLALLIATWLALLAGPLLWVYARHRPGLIAALDGFVLFAISALVILEVVPEALRTGGMASLGFLLLGTLGPSALEHLLSRLRREAHVATLLLALLGLVLHSVADGTALAGHSGADGHGHDALGLAVAIHTIPVGLAIWWLLVPSFGPGLPSIALLAMALATLAGFHFETDLQALTGTQGWAWFQSLIAGSIFHVVFGRPHLEHGNGHHDHAGGHPTAAAATGPYEGLGNIAALVMLAVIELLHLPGADDGHRFTEGFLMRLAQLAATVAPWALLGLLASAALSQARFGRALTSLPGKPPLSYAVLAGLFATAPFRQLPSHHGGPKTPAAYAIGAAGLGLMALSVSVPLVGSPITGLRFALVAAVACAAGWALSLRRAGTAAAGVLPHDPAAVPGRLRAGMAILDSATPSLVCGLILAALAYPLLPTVDWLNMNLGTQVLLLVALALPLQLGAVAATPMAAAFLESGVAPGAVLAFLVARPALDFRLLGSLVQREGRLAAVAVSLSLLALAVIGGLLMNTWPAPGVPSVESADTVGASLVQKVCLAILVALTISSLLRRGGRAFFGQSFEAGLPSS